MKQNLTLLFFLLQMSALEGDLDIESDEEEEEEEKKVSFLKTKKMRKC